MRTITFYGVYNKYTEEWWLGPDCRTPQRFNSLKKANTHAAQWRARLRMDAAESQVLPILQSVVRSTKSKSVVVVVGTSVQAVNKRWRARTDIDPDVADKIIRRAKYMRGILKEPVDYAALLSYCSIF